MEPSSPTGQNPSAEEDPVLLMKAPKQLLMDVAVRLFRRLPFPRRGINYESHIISQNGF